MRGRLYLLSCLVVAALVGCGSNSGGNTDAGGGGDDGGGSGVDAPPFGGMCTPGGDIECSDCVDNDMDGKIDGTEVVEVEILSVANEVSRGLEGTYVRR